MKKSGRVVQVVGAMVSVAIDGNADASVAPCCTVPSIVLEAKNPQGLEVHPGELVEVTDGLGTMALGGAAFLVFPGVLYGTATAFLDFWWVGVLAIVAGIAMAVPLFKSLKLDQFPRVIRRVGLAEESAEKEYL